MDTGVIRQAAQELYAVVSGDGDPAGRVSREVAQTLGTAGLLDLIGDVQAVINTLSGVQAVAMAHVAAFDEVQREDGTDDEAHHGIGHERLDGPDLIAPRLGCSAQVASSRVATAINQCTRTPAVIGAMGSGVVDVFKARVVTDELSDASPAVAAAVVARLGDPARTPSGWEHTPGPLRRRCRQLLGALDADVLAARAVTAHTWRGLYRDVETLGLDRWEGFYPPEVGRVAWAAVDAEAHRLFHAGQADTIAHARADAHMNLLLGNVTATVVVHTTRPARPPAPPSPADTQAANNSGAAADSGLPTVVELRGLDAPGSTYVRADWLAGPTEPGEPADKDTDKDTSKDQAPSFALPASAAGIRIVAGADLTCDPTTGAILSGDVPTGLSPQGRKRKNNPSASEDGNGNGTGTGGEVEVHPGYRVPAPMARLIKLRDGHCRFPGCTINARYCDLDHARPWPTGATHPHDLYDACRRHHRIKQRHGWAVRLDPDGIATWTDPTGHTQTTYPTNHAGLPPNLPTDAALTEAELTHPALPARERDRQAPPPYQPLADHVHRAFMRHEFTSRDSYDTRSHMNIIRVPWPTPTKTTTTKRAWDPPSPTPPF